MYRYGKNMITKHDYNLGEYVLSWDWDPDEQDAGNLKENNLYIDGVWNMRDTVVAQRPDSCVGLQIIDDKSFCFTTFLGMKYNMIISDGRVELLSRMCVK